MNEKEQADLIKGLALNISCLAERVEDLESNLDEALEKIQDIQRGLWKL